MQKQYKSRQRETARSHLKNALCTTCAQCCDTPTPGHGFLCVQEAQLSTVSTPAMEYRDGVLSPRQTLCSPLQELSGQAQRMLLLFQSLISLHSIRPAAPEESKTNCMLRGLLWLPKWSANRSAQLLACSPSSSSAGLQEQPALFWSP